jgi:hypothetical protein
MLLLASAIPAASALASARMLRRLDWLEVLTAIDGPPRPQK